METAKSKNDVSIRLPDERWLHITGSHSELAGLYSDVLETIEDPDAIFKGESGELLATREARKSSLRSDFLEYTMLYIIYIEKR